MNPIQKLLLDGEIPMNCYVLERDKKCFIIDPGYQKESIQNYIAQKGYTVKGILLTHAHIDHIEALDCFAVPIYIHEKEYEILIDTAKNGFDFFEKKPQYDLADLEIVCINENSKLSIGNDEITVLHTPGHTKGSVCYLVGFDLYAGDTLFEASVGKWDRPTGDLRTLKKTIVHLINSLPDYILVHPGHGRSTTIGIEKQINSFYHQWSLEQNL
jgi:hydroxyacylglutathione hydrolase